MYIMMCEIRNHTDFHKPENDIVTLLTAHPIDAVETRDESNAWMFREPRIIVNHLNDVTDDEWFIGQDCSETHAQILNKKCTLERMYIAREI